MAEIEAQIQALAVYYVPAEYARCASRDQYAPAGLDFLFRFWGCGVADGRRPRVGWTPPNNSDRRDESGPTIAGEYQIRSG